MFETEYKRGSGLKLSVCGFWEIDSVSISLVKGGKALTSIDIPRVMLEDVIGAMRKEVEAFDAIDKSFEEYSAGVEKFDDPVQCDFDFLKDTKEHKCNGGCSCHTN